MVQEELESDPFASCLFLFCNREKRILKGLWWDRQRILHVAETTGKGPVPMAFRRGEARQINVEELKMLLAGIDFWKAHKVLDYRQVMNK